MLISGLSFSLGDAERMLIVGESGAGKSSLLRAMAGLWTTGLFIAAFFVCVSSAEEGASCVDG